MSDAFKPFTLQDVCNAEAVLRAANIPMFIQGETMTEPTSTRDHRIEACARGAYETDAAYFSTIESGSTPRWSELSGSERAAWIEGVLGIMKGRSPQDIYVERFNAGQETVKYEDLPAEKRTRDQLYLAVVHEMLTALQLWRA